jgi:hypothetical protein
MVEFRRWDFDIKQEEDTPVEEDEAALAFELPISALLTFVYDTWTPTYKRKRMESHQPSPKKVCKAPQAEVDAAIKKGQEKKTQKKTKVKVKTKGK